MLLEEEEETPGVISLNRGLVLSNHPGLELNLCIVLPDAHTDGRTAIITPEKVRDDYWLTRVTRITAEWPLQYD